MDPTNGSDIEALIPAGLYGQIRDKARDALMTASAILSMSRTDILDRIQDLAKANGLTPQSARAWLLFSKEMQDQAQDVGRKVGDKGSQRTLSKSLGYSRDDMRAIGAGAVFCRGMTGTGIGADAADDVRRELNREAGHHGDSIGGRNGAFSYDQIVDGWGGAGGGGRDADGVGLDDLEGETGLDMESENDFGADGIKIAYDAHERLPGASVMPPDDLGEVQLAGGVQRSRSGHIVDHQDTFQAGKGGLSAGWHKAASKRNPRESAMARAEAEVAALNRKMGGFRGTDKEFLDFAKANPDLDKNQLRHLGKGLSNKDYLGFRVFVENGNLLGNRGHGDGRIATMTKACLLMVSEDSARRFQNELMKKMRLFSRLPDPGIGKVSIAHLERMEKPLPRLIEEHKIQVENKEAKKAGKSRDEIQVKDKGTKKTGKSKDEPSLER